MGFLCINHSFNFIQLYFHLFMYTLQVESTQRMIRIVGLSATLPNYLEVSEVTKLVIFKSLLDSPNCFVIHHCI